MKLHARVNTTMHSLPLPHTVYIIVNTKWVQQIYHWLIQPPVPSLLLRLLSQNVSSDISRGRKYEPYNSLKVSEMPDLGNSVKLCGVLLRHEKTSLVSSTVSKSACDEHLIHRRYVKTKPLKSMSRSARHPFGDRHRCLSNCGASLGSGRVWFYQ